jgi:hypothetical protein
MKNKLCFIFIYLSVLKDLSLGVDTSKRIKKI